MSINPIFFIVGGVIAIVFGIAPRLWLLHRVSQGRREIRAALARDGISIQEMTMRWLTRGPFPDMRPPGTRGNRGEYLYRVRAQDRGGRPLTGWIRWRPRWPWQPADRWTVRWDETPRWDPASEPERRGMSTGLFYAFLGATSMVVVAVVYLIWTRIL